ncbi:hypothetical protein [Magnetospira sp. QH-2]|uniref:hypothetical protein n=1 Tax=Magnetospira sp. (strain QH-2) TaxID=1288970 RepID=UPI0011DDBF14|nr:hypothetical protein [Magnetospira sp. QH-2]
MYTLLNRSFGQHCDALGRRMEAKVAYYRVLVEDEDGEKVLLEIEAFLKSPWTGPEAIKEAFRQADVWYPYAERRYKGASDPDNRAIGWIEQIRDILMAPMSDQVRRNAAKLVRIGDEFD